MVSSRIILGVEDERWERVLGCGERGFWRGIEGDFMRVNLGKLWGILGVFWRDYFTNFNVDFAVSVEINLVTEKLKKPCYCLVLSTPAVQFSKLEFCKLFADFLAQFFG